MGTASADGSSAPVTVAVVEASYLMRRGIAAVVDEAEELRLLDVPRDTDLLGLLDHEIDVVIIGPTWSADGSGPERALLRRIGDSRPDLGVVVLGHGSPESVLGVLEDGPRRLAYLFESSITSTERLKHAVLEVKAGSVVLEPGAFDLIAGQQRPDTGFAALTPREHEVIELIASGANNAAVASHLVLTDRAVERHINAIYRKLGLHERADQHPRVSAVLLFQAHWGRAGRADEQRGPLVGMPA